MTMKLLEVAKRVIAVTNDCIPPPDVTCHYWNRTQGKACFAQITTAQLNTVVTVAVCSMPADGTGSPWQPCQL
jgi:hypothetical protein